MRIQSNHHHAYTVYDLVGFKHYLYLLWSVVECKLRFGKSLTVHLPYEIQHLGLLKGREKAHRFISFGEVLKHLFGVKLYWENSPRLRYGIWDLAHDNTYWHMLPIDIDLCLDTGHLMLGLKSKEEFYERLDFIIQQRGEQIKHLHLHENDLVHDRHWHTRRILTKKVVEKITRGRSFIWESGAL